MSTGHPVMMVVVIIVLITGQALAVFVMKSDEVALAFSACINLRNRNNEMIKLIANYFL